MPRLFLIMPAVVFTVIGLLFAKGFNLDPNTLPSPLLGKPLPAFALPELEDSGQPFTAEQIKGPALINFWASWCAACRDEHALLLDLAKNFGVAIYGIDFADQRPAATQWLADQGNPYTRIIYDEQGMLSSEFKLLGAPESYLIDREGMVRYRHAGALTMDVWNAMQAVLVKPVAGPAVSSTAGE